MESLLEEVNVELIYGELKGVHYKGRERKGSIQVIEKLHRKGPGQGEARACKGWSEEKEAAQLQDREQGEMEQQMPKGRLLGQ